MSISTCKECGSKDLTWQTSNIVENGIQQGRLKTEDVTCVFFLGCNECSETLEILQADRVAEFMNELRHQSEGGG